MTNKEEEREEELQNAAEDLSPEEWRMLKSLTSPSSEDKSSIFGFFHKIIGSKDTTKTSYLDDHELEAVRILKEATNYTNIMNLPLINQFINTESENILSTALSKKGFLIERSVTQKRELQTKKAGEVPRKKLFGKPEPVEE